MSVDGVDFTGVPSGLCLLEKEGRSFRVLRVLFRPLEPEKTEYAFAAREINYSSFYQRGLVGRAEEFTFGPIESITVSADPALREDIIAYAKGRYGKPGILYLAIEGEDLRWRFSPHALEHP